MTADRAEKATSDPSEGRPKGRQPEGLSALGAASTGSSSGHPLLTAMGGGLGIAETLIPGFIFLGVYAAGGFQPGMPWTAIIFSVIAAGGFTVWRLVRRQPVTQAIAGLLTVGISALLAMWSQRPEDNFVLGIYTNAAYGVVFIVSILAGWPIAGLVVGFARQEGTAWRKNRHQRRVFVGVTSLWVLMFAIRVGVELPLYLEQNVAALATTKLVLGLPLYVPVLAASWLIIRSLYREKPQPEIS